jgi:hypothetical protein
LLECTCRKGSKQLLIVVFRGVVSELRGGEGGCKVVDKVQTGILQSQKFLQAADPQQHPCILCIVYTLDLPMSRQALLSVVAGYLGFQV